MRRGMLGVIIFQSLLGAAATGLAAEVSQKPASSDGEKKKGVSGVTDAAGNPVPVRDHATPSASRNERFVRASQNVERGRAWWPYQTAYPPYNCVGSNCVADDHEADKARPVNLAWGLRTGEA